MTDVRYVYGSTGDDGATIHNEIDPATGAPSRDPSSVSVSLDGGAYTVNEGPNAYYYVDMGDGNDSLVGENMPWADSSTFSFDNIFMGGGDDYARLDRSAVRGSLDMGAGSDTVKAFSTYATHLNLQDGNDQLTVGPGDQDLSDEEAEAKAASGQTMAMDGGIGDDTLNLVGDWTVSLTSGYATVDGAVTTIVTSDQVTSGNVQLPPALNGTVEWAPLTLENGDTVANKATFANFEDINAICFTAGTMVETPDGMVPIETLKAGDPVVTADGVKPVRWIGKRHLGLPDLAGNPKLLPVMIPAGAFGNGLPTQDIRFSPQHRVVVRSEIAQRMFGTSEVLAAAKFLVGLNGIDIDGEAQGVTYVHVMFDTHTCLRVAGIDAETMYPGPEAFKMVPQEKLAELREIFGNDIDAVIEGTLVKEPFLPILKGREARTLAARHGRNGKPLFG